MNESIKVVCVKKEKDGREFNNFYIVVGEIRIPIEPKWFNVKQHYWDTKHLLEIAEASENEN